MGADLHPPGGVADLAAHPERRPAQRRGVRCRRRGGHGPAHRTDPDDQVFADDRQRRLWEHVQALPERCRQLVGVIAFADRPDYAHLAEALGMPVGSIGPTRGRCLAKLKDLLARRPSMGGRTVMTNDDFPAGVSPEVARAAAEPLDETDLALLIEVAAALDVADPVPDDLVDRDLILAGPRRGVRRGRRDHAGARRRVRRPQRPGGRDAHRDADLLRRAAHRDGDGQPHRCRRGPARRLDRPGHRGCASCSGCRRAPRRWTPTTSGRFVFEGVPEGFAQLTFVPAGDEAGTVVTPLFQL